MPTRLFPLNSLLLTVAVGLLANPAAAEQIPVESNVTAVTLYRSQAMVTRTLMVDAPAGTRELLVSGLPENIVADSLFAEGTEGLEVRAVRYRSRAVGENPREEVRQLTAEIENVRAAIELNQRNQELVNKQNAYLDKLEGFVAPAATGDLSQGVLDAEALQSVTQFAFEQRRSLLNQATSLATEARQLEKDLQLLVRKQQELTDGASQAIREAIIFVQKTEEGPQSVRLNYLVGSCGWSPSYTARANQGSDQVRIEYNGLIQQMTGEDWNNVALTLSSASPTLSAAGPGLAPFQITLRPRETPNGELPQQMAGQGGPAGASQEIALLLGQQQQLNIAFRNSVRLGENIDNNWQINEAVNKIFCAEIVSEEGLIDAARNQLGDAGEQPAMNYSIESPVSLASRNTQQMVRILATDLDSDFYHVATPILTSYVYREAEINNTSTQDLLGGPITVYLDDRFVGRSEVPSVARGQTFVVGFGADPQLRTRRELVDKENSFTGGNRETSLTYRLMVENYKDSPAQIRLIDRRPTVQDESNIRVTLLPTEQPLSDNPTYVREEAPKGLLRWDIEVPARAVGSDAYRIEYGFRLEHDRQYQVSLPGDVEKQREEFRQLQNMRYKR